MTNDYQMKLARLTSLESYLAELSKLVDREVREDELVPLAKMESVRQQLEAVPRTLHKTLTLPFEARKSTEFASLLNQLSLSNPASIYLWPSRANDCGLLEVPSLAEVNFGFPFDLNPEGILSIATSDGKDRIVLDFSEESDGRQTLEIDLFGQHWSQVNVAPELK